MKKSLLFIIALTLLCPYWMIGQAYENISPEPEGNHQAFHVEIQVVQDASCLGCHDGQAEVTFDQEEGVTYDILWNTTPPQTGTTATGLGSGLYTATVTTSEGQTDTDAASIIELFSVQDAQANVKTYPNPSQGNLFVEFNQLWDNISLDLFNLVGQKVLHQRISSRLLHDVDLHSLEKGVYLLKISLHSINQTITKRIVLN
ncbi:MAG: T9SS type A sorting domain-containing protein [Bacteroidota bacterium]